MCHIAKQCSNFTPITPNKMDCALICKRNPLAVQPYHFYPDFYGQKDLEDGDTPLLIDVDNSNMLNLDPQEVLNKKLKNVRDKVMNEYEQHKETYSNAEFETGNDEVNYNPETNQYIDLEKINKLSQQSSTDDIIKRAKAPKNMSEKVMELTQPIEMETQMTEVTTVDTPVKKKDNVKNYVSNGKVGRPKMSDDEKKASKEKREYLKKIEKIVEEKEKEKEKKEKKKKDKKKNDKKSQNKKETK